MCMTSESISKIAAALVAFSGDVKAISHDATNPHFKSDYTSLDHMIEETKPLLHKHGLTVMQFPGGDGEKITVQTMILHTSGEWIKTEPLTLRPVKNDPQGAGSAITYARRYSYASALSLALGDDDDGNAASYAPGQAQMAPQAPRPAYAPQASINGVQRQNGADTSAAVMVRVFKLREELGMNWNDLNDLASNLLGREIKFLKKDITDVQEWKLIEEALKESKSNPEPQPELEPVPAYASDLPF